MIIFLLILCSLSITYLAKNKTIEDNARAVSLFIFGVITLCSLFF